MAGEVLFFSDCHLDPGRPEVIDRLIEFLDGRAAAASKIYILGDLFEVWLGDDDPATGLEGVVNALRRVAGRAELAFLAGNRDFLLGNRFAERVGMRLLDEPELIELEGNRVALIHGDTLCTDDHDYQAFRRMVRNPEWQREFLAQPLAERQRVAAQLRSDSAAAMTQKSSAIMDVNRAAVSRCFADLEVGTIIHGHTHRPAVHDYPDEGRRFVLGDWNPGPSYISWTASQGLKLHDARA